MRAKNLPPDVARLQPDFSRLPVSEDAKESLSAGIRRAVAEYAARYLVRPCNCPEHAYTLEQAMNAAEREDETRTRRAILEGSERREGQPMPIAEAQRRLEKLGVPLVHREGLARRLGPKPTLEATRRWWGEARKDFPLLSLFGPGNAGKTQAAAWALWQWVQRYNWEHRPSGGRQTQPAFFITTASLGTYCFDEAKDEVKRAAFVVLDELGGNSLNGPSEELVGELLDYRYSRCLPTVLTGNTSLRSFEARFDGARPDGAGPGRLTRRILERGWVLDGLELKAGVDAHVVHRFPLMRAVGATP
jgi:hypothetical protein